MYYIVRQDRNAGRNPDHIARNGAREAILAGDYRLLCGNTINPRHYGIVSELDPRCHHLCKNCRAVADRDGL